MQKKRQKHKSQWEVFLFFSSSRRYCVLQVRFKGFVVNFVPLHERRVLWGLTAAIFTAGHSTIFVNSSNFHRTENSEDWDIAGHKNLFIFSLDFPAFVFSTLTTFRLEKMQVFLHNLLHFYELTEGQVMRLFSSTCKMVKVQLMMLLDL